MKNPVPTKEGFFWAQWNVKRPGSSDMDVKPGDEWEVMHVVENTIDEDDEEHLMVMVPGEERWQPVSNFNWGAEVKRET